MYYPAATASGISHWLLFNHPLLREGFVCVFVFVCVCVCDRGCHETLHRNLHTSLQRFLLLQENFNQEALLRGCCVLYPPLHLAVVWLETCFSSCITQRVGTTSCKFRNDAMWHFPSLSILILLEMRPNQTVTGFLLTTAV